MKLTGELVLRIPLEVEVDGTEPNHINKARLALQELGEIKFGHCNASDWHDTDMDIRELDYIYTDAEEAVLEQQAEAERKERDVYHNKLKALIAEKGYEIKNAVESFVPGVWGNNKDIDKALALLDGPYLEGKIKLVDDGWDGKFETGNVLEGPTVVDLLIEFDKLIELSGDTHHVFLEGFNRVADEDGVRVYNVITGS